MVTGWDRVKVFQEFPVRVETGMVSSTIKVPGLNEVPLKSLPLYTTNLRTENPLVT